MRALIFLLILSLLTVYGCGSAVTQKTAEPETVPRPNGPAETDDGDDKAGVDHSNADGRVLMINVYVTKYKKIVPMPFEDYVKGVVAAEMPAAFESEALKAQAVAARTYALARLKEYAGSGCDLHSGADICTDPAHCQAYAEKQDMAAIWGSNADYYWNKISAAVEDTKGMVAMYDDLLIDPVFHAISGGRTENSEDVWKNKIPYLRSVDSPYEEEASKFKSSRTLSNSEFVSILRKKVPGLKINQNSLKAGVKILDHTAGGRVKNIRIGNKTVSGRDFQAYMGLNSNNFTLKFDKKTVTISVKGYGHGVGMSQYGANGQARHGSSYIDILKHYYSGIEVTNMWWVLEN